MSNTRYLSVWVLLLMLTPTPAAAQNFGVREWKLHDVKTGDLIDTKQELNEFFNQASCECALPMELNLRIQGDYQSSDFEFQVVAGRNCLDTVNQTVKDTCIKLFGPVKANTLKGDVLITQDVNKNPLTAKLLMENSCTPQDRKSFEIVLFTDKDDDGKWEEDSTKLEYTVDTQAPDPPRDASVNAGEGQVKISFKSHTSETTSSDAGSSAADPNFKGYQVLCETISGDPGLANPKSPEFRAAINVCGSTAPAADLGSTADGGSGMSVPVPRAGDGSSDAAPADGAATDAGPTDAGPTDGPTPDTPPTTDGPSAADGGQPDSGATAGGALSFGASYVCSDLQQSAGEVTVSGLRNGVAYRFFLVTVDEARNPSQPILAGEGTPELAEDLWERYKRLGGKAEGGYCFVATATHGSYNHPHVRVLREFRDRVLLPTREGRLFVQLYYAASPGPAAWLARTDHARSVARVLLWPVTVGAAAYLYTSSAHKGLVLLTLVLGIGLFVRRRRR